MQKLVNNDLRCLRSQEEKSQACLKTVVNCDIPPLSPALAPSKTEQIKHQIFKKLSTDLFPKWRLSILKCLHQLFSYHCSCYILHCIYDTICLHTVYDISYISGSEVVPQPTSAGQVTTNQHVTNTKLITITTVTNTKLTTITTVTNTELMTIYTITNTKLTILSNVT